MTTDLQIEQDYSSASLTLLDVFRRAVDRIADTHNLDNPATAKKLLLRFVDHVGGEKAPAGELDGRTAQWRCRFRIYNPAHDDPIADSDDELSPDKPGAMVVSGLPNVALEVRELARAFHVGKAIMGLSGEELERRLKGLRPTLSRKGGVAVWRVPYETVEGQGTTSARKSWLMRVDIIREQEKQNA